MFQGLNIKASRGMMQGSYARMSMLQGAKAVQIGCV